MPSKWRYFLQWCGSVVCKTNTAACLGSDLAGVNGVYKGLGGTVTWTESAAANIKTQSSICSSGKLEKAES